MTLLEGEKKEEWKTGKEGTMEGGEEERERKREERGTRSCGGQCDSLAYI